MISLILAVTPPAIIQAIDPLDEEVKVDANSITRYSLRAETYTCEMKSYEGENNYQFKFSRTGGEAFLTGNKRIPIGRKPTSVVVLSNSSPYPLDNPTRVYASGIQTILNYDNPGYVPMVVNASQDYARLEFRPGFTDDEGNPVVRAELYGKCAVEASKLLTASPPETQK